MTGRPEEEVSLKSFVWKDLRELYRLLFESALDALYVLDSDSDRFLLVNDAFLRLTGYSRAELIEGGTPSERLVAPEAREAFRARLRDRAAPPSEIYEIEFVTKPGEPRRAELAVRRIPLEDRRLVLGCARDVTARARAAGFQAALVDLAKSTPGDPDAGLGRLLETAARRLGVERVSFWRFTDDRSELVCEDLFVLSSGRHESGARLGARLYPRYFEAVNAGRLVPADDARHDPRTSEFAEGYLTPLGITSMMDASVRLHGKLAGVLCHEHTGSARAWTPEEHAFASSLADLVSLLLEDARLLETQKALRESEERFRKVFEEGPAGMCLTGPDLTFLRVNAAFCRMLGRTEAELLGQPFSRFTHPEDVQGNVQGAKDLLEGRIPAYRTEKRYLAKSGETVWGSLTAAVLRNEAGQPLHFLSIVEDITGRKREAGRLAQAMAELNAIFEALPDLLFRIASDGTVLEYKSGRGADPYVPPERFAGRRVQDILPPGPGRALQDGISRALLTGAAVAEYSLPLHGHERHFEARLLPFAGDQVIAVVRDITERRHLQAVLEKQVRLEKRKTLEAFQNNVRIYQLTEKVRAAYELAAKLVHASTADQLLDTAVRQLCDPAGLDYREAAIYAARGGFLELAAASPARPPARIPVDAPHPLAAAYREEGAQPPDAGAIWMALKGKAGPLGVLEVRVHGGDASHAWQENILRTLANSLSLILDNLQLYEVVLKQSITDSLTGTYNRRHLDEKLGAEVERAVRYRRSLSLVLLDLDDFKRVNDTGGHAQGDAVLAEIGLFLRSQSRTIDIVARYGGEEFALILPETGLENAVLHAERLREACAKLPFANLRTPAAPLRVTASFGVAEVDQAHATVEALLRAADEACYLAKHAGKNRVCAMSDIAGRHAGAPA